MRIILLLFLLLNFSITRAQTRYAAEEIAPALKARANATVRDEITTIDMRAPDNVVQTVYKVITVFNKNGDDFARLVIFYNKSISIKSINGEVYNADGNLTGRFTERNFQDESAVNAFSLYEDSRVKHFLPAVQNYPYTIAYTYEIRHKQNLIIPDWVPNPYKEVSVEKSTYHFICKADDKLTIKTAHNAEKTAETIVKDIKTYTWEVHNLPALKAEPYMPFGETYQASVKIAPQKFTYYNKKGTYQNWAELGAWVYNDLLKDRRALHPGTVAEIKALIKGAATEKEMARRIYAFLQQKTRYISVQIGIGGFQPFAAAVVDEMGYGDCKALVNYMQSLLEVAGIDSYYCVVEAGSAKKDLDPSFASMTQGNHIILCLPFKNDTTWLECTSQKIPFGFLGDFTDDRYVLACKPTGGEILRTPKYTANMNSQLREGNFQLLADGTLKGELVTIFKGTQYQNHEEAVYLPAAERTKKLIEYYNIDNIAFSSIDYKQVKDTAPSIEESLKLEIRRFAVPNGNWRYLQPNIFNIQGNPVESRNRLAELFINRGYIDEDVLTIKMPENTDLTNLKPVEQVLSNEFGSYKLQITLSGNTIRFYRKLVLNEGTYPPSAYEAFFKFMTAVYSADRSRLTLPVKS